MSRRMMGSRVAMKLYESRLRDCHFPFILLLYEHIGIGWCSDSVWFWYKIILHTKWSRRQHS